MKSVIDVGVEPVPAELIDELGPLLRDLADLRKKEERAKLLKEQLVAVLKLKPMEERTEHGKKWWISISGAQNRRHIKDMPRLFALLTKGVFLANCGFTLENLDKLVAEPVRSTMVIEEPVGPRKFQTFEKAAMLGRPVARAA